MADQAKTPEAEYDAKHGKYDVKIPSIPVDDRVPQAALPMAPKSAPFKVGPMVGPAK